MNTAIIEFNSLTDSVRASAENENLALIRYGVIALLPVVR